MLQTEIRSNNNDNEVVRISSVKKDIRGEIRERCVRMVSDAMSLQGIPMDTMVSELLMSVNQLDRRRCDDDRIVKTTRLRFLIGAISVLTAVAVVAVAAMLSSAPTHSPVSHLVPSAAMHILPSSSRCLLDNNFLVREATRPPTDCSICLGVTGAHVFYDSSTLITRDSFADLAYSGRPMLAKGAALNWPATTTFSFDFFRQLYVTDDGRMVDGALDSVEDECQFFPFRTKFAALADVFAMPPERANGSIGQEPWYIGWSNCDPRVAQILRKHYSRPHFLPAESESSAIDWIFMGWPGQGSSIHLDYVQRPSWQAQISGRKTWRLFPVPECENECESFQITVEKGDIVFVDTNQWYHDTFIEPGEISITIGSEYD